VHAGNRVAQVVDRVPDQIAVHRSTALRLGGRKKHEPPGIYAIVLQAHGASVLLRSVKQLGESASG
jgi:hypothetical protein